MNLVKLPIYILLLMVLGTNNSSAQEANDPNAAAILKKFSKYYKSLTSMEIDFKLNIELAEQKPENITGNMKKKGTKYNVTTSKQSVFNDGKALYVYIPNQNEVQILDPNDKSDNELMMSPTELLNIAESKSFIYAKVGEGKENGKNCVFIEFKPVKKNSQFSKIRLALDKNNTQAVSMKAFSKDGSRFTMNITNQQNNKSYTDDIFTFNKAKYPKVKMNDLRID